jgi:peptide/nickel transport system substrate-binding protein
MTALYRPDRQSDALAACREVRSRLHHELGIAPTSHLQKLHQAVLAQDPVLDWEPQAATESPAKAPGTRLDVNGPDLVRAHELVRLSGTRGMAVTIQGTTGDHELNAYFATVLRQLGYTVKLREVPTTLDNDLLRALGHVQVISGPGWIADHPAPSNFFDGLFSCRTAVGGAGWYCNARVERTIAAAHAAELVDPGTASRLWAEVDRLITDDAPVVALGNLTPSIFVSSRVGNYQSSPWVGPLLSEMWVK